MAMTTATVRTEKGTEVEAVRLRCAQAMCSGCLKLGAPTRNHGGAPHINGGTCSGAYVHKVQGGFTNCAAGEIWLLEL